MRTALLAPLLLALAACGGARQARVETFLDELPPPALLPTEALPVDVVLRQHVTARWTEGETSFDAIVQKHEDVLKLVALSPTGQPGFVLTLEPSGEVQVENRTDRELPFRPERILADVQKVHFPWIEGEVPREGTLRGRALGYEVEERFEDGRLVERRFAAGASPEGPEVIVRYGDWDARRVAPSVATLTHSLGYELTVETFEEIILAE